MQEPQVLLCICLYFVLCPFCFDLCCIFQATRYEMKLCSLFIITGNLKMALTFFPLGQIWWNLQAQSSCSKHGLSLPNCRQIPPGFFILCQNLIFRNGCTFRAEEACLTLIGYMQRLSCKDIPYHLGQEQSEAEVLAKQHEPSPLPKQSPCYVWWWVGFCIPPLTDFWR